MEQKTVFRQKSLDRIASPEQLNDYIRVSSPSVWLILSAVILLLAGVCVWGIFGHLDSKKTAFVVAGQGKITAYISEADMDQLEEGMVVEVEQQICTISVIEDKMCKASEVMDEYQLHQIGMEGDGWIGQASLEGILDEGSYKGFIIVDRVAPASFVLN